MVLHTAVFCVSFLNWVTVLHSNYRSVPLFCTALQFIFFHFMKNWLSMAQVLILPSKSRIECVCALGHTVRDGQPLSFLITDIFIYHLHAGHTKPQGMWDLQRREEAEYINSISKAEACVCCVTVLFVAKGGFHSESINVDNCLLSQTFSLIVFV